MKAPVNNFGDLLGPMIVDLMLQRRGIDPASGGNAQLVTIGSVLHFARDGATIWGAGRNGKVREDKHAWSNLDVRAVRGPLTASFLRNRGVIVPRVFGDPALLLPELMPELQDWASAPKLHTTTVVLNLNDSHLGSQLSGLIDPRRPVMEVLEHIARSHFVVASSLHAIVVAESVGIPARMLKSTTEPVFKYQDYYEATGRPGFVIAEKISDALEMGGEKPAVWDSQLLIDAFPYDLWGNSF